MHSHIVLVGLTLATTALGGFGSSGILSSSDCCKRLEKLFPGKVIWPHDSLYLSQQSSYYSAEQASLEPQCRVSPTLTSEVSSIMAFASNNLCHFAVRGGGHMAWNGASNIGASGFTIDLQGLNGVALSDDRKVVHISSGARWRDVYTELMPYNLTSVGGRVGDVGVGGFLLGGGIGFLSAEHGFGSDNVVNYEVVLSDGKIVNANTSDQSDHSDLFWALKLGSTNFGIVIRFDVLTYPQGEVWAGSQFFKIEHAPSLLDSLVAFTRKLSHDPKGFYGVSLAWNPQQQDYIIWTLQTYLEPTPHPPLWSDFAGISPLVDMMGIKRLIDVTEEFQEADAGKQGRSFWLSMTIKANAQFPLDLHAKGWELFEPFREREGARWAVSFQPIPRRLFTASLKKGGNPSCLSGEESELLVVLISVDWLESSDDSVMKEKGQELLYWAEDEAKRRGLFSPFVYINYAGGIQAAMKRSVDEKNLDKMLAIKQKYDPRGILDEIWAGGFKLPRRESQERDRIEL